MIKAIYAGKDKTLYTDIIEGFQKAGIHITPVDSGNTALGMISDTSFNLLITDDTLQDMNGKVLIEKAVMQNPFMSFAVTGSEPEKKFHDAYEGLGVLMQLACPPGISDARKLAGHMDKISGLLQKSGASGKGD